MRLKGKKSMRTDAEKKEVISKPAPKEKTEAYIMRKNATMRMLRILLWTILIFVFIRGLASIFKQDKEAVVNQLIQDFKTNYNTFTNQNREMMSFAENFAKEYLTYKEDGENEYKKRLEGYVSKTFFNGTIQDFNVPATATYVNAYRIEEYSATQSDVFVLAEVQYINQVPSEEGYTEELINSQLILKVPVYHSGGAYVVENIPQFVSDSLYLESYAPEEHYGTSVPDEEAVEVKISVENFLNAYLEADESVINYYLDGAANKADFQGLNKRFTLESIDNIQCYQLEDSILCLVEYKVRDSGNEAVLLQKINVTLRKSGEKYYIVSMDTRTGNLNIESEEN